MLKIYLDSSVMVKRYISEPGSSAVDYIFNKGWADDVFITTSIWNIGEVLGVLDERRRRGWLSEKEFKNALESFAGETLRLLRLKVLQIFPVLTSILTDAWPLILSEHTYEADSLQIQTCLYSGSNILLSGDKKLIGVALKTGLKAVNVEDEDDVKKIVK